MKKDWKGLVEVVRNAGTRGLSAHELSVQLHVKPQQRQSFYSALHEAVRTKALTEKKGRFYSVRRDKLLDARIVSVKEGFGFASISEGAQDVFVPGRYLMGAMPGDQVQLRLQQGRGDLPEGEVVRITHQNVAPFSGVYQERGGRGEILPDHGSRIPVRVSKGRLSGAREGDKVLGRLVQRGASHMDHRAEVAAVFGPSSSAAACCDAILAAEGIERAFPEDVLAEAERVQAAGLAESECAGRLDLRDQMIFTIDGADTKDIDDAISIEKRPEGWRLGVHIADVSHYVRPKSLLDLEALERGTSVYFADSVVPMLPPALSNGICSLNPDEDRLAFSALLTLSPEGAIEQYEFRKTLIRSRLKGVYGEVNQILDGTANEAVRQRYGALLDSIFAMKELAGCLSGRRAARGGMDLSSPESKVTVGADGCAQAVTARVSGCSEGIIEEFMLTANEAAADYALKRELPFVYRIHESPSVERVDTLCDLLDRLGLDPQSVRRGCTSGALAGVLRQAREAGLDLVVNNQILRTMAKARYDVDNKGHFGLTLERYTHFTSPIRRYPDLAIHRILSESVSGVGSEQLRSRYGAFADEAARQSSARELRAMNTERACEECYKAEYMSSRLGECYEGVITAATPRGLYVMLPSTIEGFIRLENLPQGHYDCDAGLELVELGAGKRYRVGDPITITVAGADVSSGRVDFTLAQTSYAKRGDPA